MSRIGRQPIEIPSGVDVKVGDDSVVTVKGPRGTLSQRLHAEIMGATLTIQSRPRRGTEVRVVLPLTAPRPTNDTASM